MKEDSDVTAAAHGATPALRAQEWQPIATVPSDQTVILANFIEACLLTGAPHVWTATYVTKWISLNGTSSPDVEPMWCECSHAATNQNGEPTHWMPLPPRPPGKVVRIDADKPRGVKS